MTRPRDFIPDSANARASRGSAQERRGDQYQFDAGAPLRDLSRERARLTGLRVLKRARMLSYTSVPPVGSATVANSAYHTWASMSHAPAGDLPPERFQVNVLKM